VHAAILCTVTALILGTFLFQWYSTLRMTDCTGSDLFMMMWQLWRATSKVWIMLCLLLANIWLLISIVVVSIVLREAFPIELILYSLIVTLGTLSWNLVPPTVLFLANSREESSRVAVEIQRLLLAKGLRVAYLLDPVVAAPVDSLRFYMDNFRNADNLEWERAVHSLMRAVPIVVIDVRVPSVGVSRETEFNVGNGYSCKTVFIVESDGRSELLDHVIPSPQARAALLVSDEATILQPIARLISSKGRRRGSG